MPRILAIFLALGAIGGAIAERAVGDEGGDPPPATTSQAAVEPAATVSLELSKSRPVWGTKLVAVGSATGVPAGTRVVVEHLDGAAWELLGVAATDQGGSFGLGFVARVGGELRARLEPAGTVSPIVPLTVFPKAQGQLRDATAFAAARIVVRVRPWSYTGRARAVVVQRGDDVAQASGVVRRGKLVVRAPLPGFGRFRVRVELPAAGGLAAKRITVPVEAAPEPVSYGSRGPSVRALTHRLIELGFYLPGPSAEFGQEEIDAVYAFQKAIGLARTGAIGEEDWRRLAAAHTPRPRYRRPADHLEVDIARQILLVVRDHEVTGVVPVSTGALGNTPLGKWNVRRKDPWTTTWLGPAILYRTMTFYENSVAVHGFPSVPPYPASHGCVRVPMWAADWLYNQTPVGQRIYVY